MALFGLLSLRTSSGHFAEVKNVGRRILDIRNQIRADLSHLLAHNYAYASGRALSPVKRMKAARANRGWRKEGRQLMARLWLAMSNVDSLTERWLDSLRSLQDSRYDIGEMFLFGYDMRSDISEIEAIDLQRVVDAMNQVASTFDSRVLAVSTSLGALGGAVAGSVITVASQ
ncbi:hypothetical protein SAMN05443575_4018 [Jatrophihabitans endophyticus]|uniref:Uncharacterized protein n=2 Tax=Jatrophihabitans endophyticus TaxID=1206085 RepID=A0A1M5TRH0_9ACTN|nr:hypothetical protein SAMN05443575_4018 [Jatrophihabitans endophyticus]